MVKRILQLIVLAIVLLAGFAATRPDTFRLERSIDIKAPPEKIFSLIDNFKNWAAWSPWEKLDPALKRTYSGPESGKGAAYAWEGNNDVGAGRMEIVESSPSSKVGIKLDFTRPFEAHNRTEFTLAPSGDTTKVTWAMSGPNPFFARLIQIFMSMDKMVGGDFERGLANMKAQAEKS